MAFVNERISEEDREKYNLDALWAKYQKDKAIHVLCKSPYEWTIDKNDDIQFIYFARVVAEWLEHGPGFTHEHIAILIVARKVFEVHLISADEKKEFSQDGLHTTAYSVTWELKSIIPEPEKPEEFKTVLKEALETYGMDGLFSENIKSNTTVVCNF